MRDYGSQLNALKESGVITAHDESNITSALQHTGEGRWEIAKFDLGNGKTVVLKDLPRYNAAFEHLDPRATVQYREVYPR